MTKTKSEEKEPEEKELTVSEQRTQSVYQKRLYDAFQMLLLRAMHHWDRYVNFETGIVIVPITDWDRVQNPVLGTAKDLEFNVSTFLLTGTDQRIPPGVLNRDHPKANGSKK